MILFLFFRTSVIGGLINSYLASATNMNDQTIHLLFSANRWEASQNLEMKLRAGTTLVSALFLIFTLCCSTKHCCRFQICDRYAYSGVAFSAAKGLDLEWCKSCDGGLIAPDCIIYLDMSVEDAAKRGNYGEERYEKEEFQRSVRSRFMELKARDTVPWFVIDAMQTKESIHESISAISEEVVAKLTPTTPLSRLWGGLSDAVGTTTAVAALPSESA